MQKIKGAINSVQREDYIEFRCTIPIEWFSSLDINKHDPVTIYFFDGAIHIKKATSKFFKSMSKYEKILQIKKFESEFGEYNKKKDLVDSAALYFNVNARTIYRLINESASEEDIYNTVLLDKQEENYCNVNILYKKVQKWESAYLYLRNEYVKKLLLNNDTEELYSKSYTYPVELVLENNEILIYSI